jgi:hypothetical protein
MVSMDGVMQAPGGPEEDPTGGFKFGGWVAPLADVDPVFGAEIGKLFGEPFDLLLNRRTYDMFAAHWPYAEGGSYDDIARAFMRDTYLQGVPSDVKAGRKAAPCAAGDHSRSQRSRTASPSRTPSAGPAKPRISVFAASCRDGTQWPARGQHTAETDVPRRRRS